jgi:superfamily I DNA and/or RNA helicase
MENSSYFNEGECKVIHEIVSKYLSAESTSIGVITPYQSQKKQIDLLVNNSLVVVNTVDSFQGQEKDVIIVSTVRGNGRGSIGFLSDDRRTNVTLTRGRYLLVVVGNSRTIGSCETWKCFI